LITAAHSLNLYVVSTYLHLLLLCSLSLFHRLSLTELLPTSQARQVEVYKSYHNGMLSSHTVTTLSSMLPGSPVSGHHVVIGDLVIEYGGSTDASDFSTPASQVNSFFEVLICLPMQILLA